MVTTESRPQADQPGRDEETRVVIHHGERDAAGDPIEPEEQHAEIVQPIRAQITLGHGPMREDVAPEALGSEVRDLIANGKTAHLAHQMSAGELAQSVIQRCGHCIHFDRAGWAKVLREAEASGDPMRLRELNEVRGHLAEQLQVNVADQNGLGADGNPDLEAMLRSIGRCMALTEHMKETIFVTPMSSCPDDQPLFFKPRRTGEERRARASGYDWIMHRAQGRRE